MLEFIPVHHVILLKALLHSYELNTLHARWIAIDVWSNSSRCRQESVYVLVTNVMPIFMIIALDIVITLHFSINCSTVICLPTVCFLNIEASSETYGPRVYFPSYIFRSTNQKTQKYLAAIYLYLL